GGCTVAADCPEPEACHLATCNAGVCGSQMAPGADPGGQTTGDCKGRGCDASGKAGKQLGPSDGPQENQDCTTDKGDDKGAPIHTPVAKGTACATGGKVCNDSGECVECNVDSDCMGGVCSSQMCVPLTCTDGKKNGGEADVDCGGPDCAP